jgi:hypothetical protein
MTIKPSGLSLNFNEIDQEFSLGTNLNSYRGTTWHTVNSAGAASSGTFSSGAISASEFYSKAVISPYFTATSPQANRWAWGVDGWAVGDFGAAQNVRGRYYVSRQLYGTTTLRDAYGNPYAGAGLYFPGNSVANSYDTVSFTNNSRYSVDVEVQVYVGRSTDDITRNLVFRGGSIANTYTHSGGTLVLDTGNTTGSYFTVIETVPGNTTYTWYNYCSIVNGWGADGCTSWIAVKFVSRTGERAVSPQIGRWAWGVDGWAVGDFGAAQNVRGRYYISRQLYGTTTLRDAYGNPYSGTGLFFPGNSVANSYDVLSYTNSYPYTVTVELEVNVGRSTDDITRNFVYRGGSIANTFTHSGGTLVLDTGNTTGTRWVVIENIPANTTYTWYNYSGVVNGGGSDGCTSWLAVRSLT